MTLALIFLSVLFVSLLTSITPPPLLPSSNAKKPDGNPIALPENAKSPFIDRKKIRTLLFVLTKCVDTRLYKICKTVFVFVSEQIH